jgi:hypothetical protein
MAILDRFIGTTIYNLKNSYTYIATENNYNVHTKIIGRCVTLAFLVIEDSALLSI